MRQKIHLRQDKILVVDSVQPVLLKRRNGEQIALGQQVGAAVGPMQAAAGQHITQLKILMGMGPFSHPAGRANLYFERKIFVKHIPVNMNRELRHIIHHTICCVVCFIVQAMLH
ncbi:hypothetical protein D3C71_1794600 [compost metagenome]